VVLQNGCICCTLRTDLQQGLRDLIDSRGRRAFPNFDRVVIETTGLADPAPIAQTLLTDLHAPSPGAARQYHHHY
jgi:G3E family GTPase